MDNLSTENVNILKSSNHNYPGYSHNYATSTVSIGNSLMYSAGPNTRNSNTAIYYPQPQHASQLNMKAPVKFIIHRGITIYQGDHASIRGSDSQVYFAILMDFWLTENGKHYCTLRWLLPRPKASFISDLQFHDRFIAGPVHERVEAMEIILDVFYSPYRDQMTAENIRRKFLLPYAYDGGNEGTGVAASIEPPVHLIKSIKSLSNEIDSNLTSSVNSSSDEVVTSSSLSLQSSPSSRLFKSSSSSSEIPMNPISVESSEIAAKMLLRMN